MWRLYGDEGLLAEQGSVVPLRPGEPLVTMEALVLASLLSDARDQEQPDPRGWWGDAFDSTGDRFGSRLWTIPQVITDQTLRQTEQYVVEALTWMTRDGIAKSVSAVASRDPDGTPGKVRLEVSIDGSTVVLLGGP